MNTICTLTIFNYLFFLVPASKEWFHDGHAVPNYILEAVGNGKWWTLRSALNIPTEVIDQPEMPL